MLRKGDPGADRPDTAAGKTIEENITPKGDQNTEAPAKAGEAGGTEPAGSTGSDAAGLLSQDEKAQKFFAEMQKLKSELNSLRDREILPADMERAAAVRKETADGSPAPQEEAASSGSADAAAGTEDAAAGTADAAAETAVTGQPAEPAAGAEMAAAAAGRGTSAAAAAGENTPVVLEPEPERSAKQAFEAQFRQQMENQMHAVRQEESQKAKQKAIKAARKEAYRREKARRNEERREERRARAKKKQLERELRAEVKRKKRLADKSAEMGGGIVGIHDTTVSTELQPVAQFRWRDLLGFISPGEKRAAASEEELLALKEEQERKTADARQAAAQLSKVRSARYRSSALGQRADAFKRFCDRHKGLLLTGLSMVLLVCVGAAGVINYCTAYEYSYNGHVLGYVKSKDQVLQITDMVQRALTEDKEIQVVIDAKDDISFQRVSLLDRDVTPDSSDQVLRRLTYMGDLNVKAYGIYINGDKAGAVRSKEDAAETLKKIEERYASDKKGTVIEKAEILETVDVRKSNTSLREVYTPDRMANLLCTSGEKETVHTVIAGETLDDIAADYATTEERLLADNEGVDPTRLEVGSTLLIRQNAPLLTVRMTEKRDYTQTIKYETVEKKTDEMFEDEQEIQQEGEDGSEEISERTVSINGELESRRILSDVVTKKPVKKIILIGTAERPPSVGDGVYIWPLASGYTLTSHFGYRWGRLHAGIDLGTHVGNDVLAADGGIVTRAGYFGGYGLCVDIDHQNGHQTRYGHLSSILVSVGDEVYEGQHIAESGNTGRSTGPHLHFEIHTNGQPHDPLQDLP